MAETETMTNMDAKRRTSDLLKKTI